MNELIESLVKARKQKGLSQAALGEKLGIPQSHISKIEKGEVDVRLSSLVDMARLLGLEVVIIPRSLISLVHNLTTPMPEHEEKSLPEMLLSETVEEEVE